MINYMQDGACPEARAVLAILQGMGEIEESWDDKYKEYTSNIQIARWENGREQGYVVYMRVYNKGVEQINIAFFQHRNSDRIHAVKWIQNTFNSPNIDIAKFGDVYKNKFDTSFSVGGAEIVEMAEWIHNELKNFYVANCRR